MQRQGGFTLVELLVSLAVLASAAAMLVSGALVTRRTADRVATTTVSTETIVTTQAILRDRIESLVANARFDFGKPITDLRGASTVFSFFAPADPALRPSTIRRYRLLRSPSGQLTLFASPDVSARVNPYAPGEAGWQRSVLLTGVDTLTIDYFGAREIGEEPRWQAEWIERADPPELVRVRLGFAAGDTRQWPDLIVRPAATVNSACNIVRTTGLCAGNT